MWSWFVEGREVRPRRAREAFWRCEQAWARRTRDIVKSVRRKGAQSRMGGCAQLELRRSGDSALLVAVRTWKAEVIWKLYTGRMQG